MIETKLFLITGHKYSGKTSVSNIFRTLYLPVIDIDSIYVDIFKPGSYAYKQVLDICGTEVINIDGELDLKKLSIFVCNQKWIRENINDIMKNEISLYISKLKYEFQSCNVGYAGLEAGIITANEISKFVDKTVFVISSRYNRNKRLQENFTKDIADKMIRLDDKSPKLLNYDLKIINNSTFQNLQNNTISILNKLQHDNQ